MAGEPTKEPLDVNDLAKQDKINFSALWEEQATTNILTISSIAAAVLSFIAVIAIILKK